MSAVTDQLGARCVVAETGCLCTGPVCQATTMADLGDGCSGRIKGFTAGVPAATARRLFDLGFTPGARVECLRHAPMRDPVIYRVADYEIALRRAQAGSIAVEPAR